jgi:hypothetical protein
MANAIEEILSQIPLGELASKLGTDTDTAMDVARKALPALLGGLSQNADSGGGGAIGTALLKDHDGSLLDLADPLKGIDPTDGMKIVGHIFGNRQDQVVETLGATSKGGTPLFVKALPLLAPLVMAWLAKRVGGALKSGAAAADSASGESGGGGGGLGGLIGGLLGGSKGGKGAATEASAPAEAQSGAGGLGALLGGLTKGGDVGALIGGLGKGGDLGALVGGLLGDEVKKGKSDMPDLGALFNILGGGKS